MMKQVPDYKDMKEELTQEDQNHHQKTLCFDVKNVLVRKIDLRDLEEINMLRDCTNFEEFVIINTVVQADEDSSGEFDNERQRKHINKLLQRNETFIKQVVQDFGKPTVEVQECCENKQQGKMCICNLELYQIRPFTFELLRSIQPFFELIAFSKMPFH